jgi:lipopolysaccharide transport system ATP-binding protein
MERIILDHAGIDFPLAAPADLSLKRNLLKLFGIGRTELKIVRAVHDLSLVVREGDRIGICGPNGSGKTTLLRMMAGIYPPTMGTVTIHGSVTAILSIGAGINQELSADLNIRILLQLDGIPVTDRLVDEIWDFVDIDDEYRFAPIRTFSSGMVMRTLFAVTTAVQPNILILDEWLSVVDATFQAKAQERMKAMAGSADALIIASHNQKLLHDTCKVILHMERGHIVRTETVD